MRKIKYPTDDKILNSFHKKYYHSIKFINAKAVNKELRKAPKFKGEYLTFKRLVTLDFNSLFELTVTHLSFINSYNTPTKTKTKTKSGKTKIIQVNKFNDMFNYKSNQPDLAGFFMNEKSLDLKICHYCGIDYINAFKDIGDYKDAKDFLNRATHEELQHINGIANKTADKIIKLRKTKQINKPEEITTSRKVINQLKSFDFSNSHNHFTLDHILPQSKYPFLSLCLYNLVPSCYSCNSKFKKAKDFIGSKEILRISPTSMDYSLTDDFDFKIFYTGSLKAINSEKDFTLYRKVYRNKAQINSYASIFKLDGRYVFHKDELVNLIENKIKHPRSKIIKMASEMGMTQEEMKKLIFGKEIFEKDLNIPFHKLKRDIAKNIKVI